MTVKKADANPRESVFFMLGQIDQKIAGLVTQVAGLASKSDFEAVRRDVENIAAANRTHHEDDDKKHGVLDGRVDKLEKERERVHGYAAGIAIVVSAFGWLIGHFVGR